MLPTGKKEREEKEKENFSLCHLTAAAGERQNKSRRVVLTSVEIRFLTLQFRAVVAVEAKRTRRGSLSSARRSHSGAAASPPPPRHPREKSGGEKAAQKTPLKTTCSKRRENTKNKYRKG